MRPSPGILLRLLSEMFPIGSGLLGSGVECSVSLIKMPKANAPVCPECSCLLHPLSSWSSFNPSSSSSPLPFSLQAQGCLLRDSLCCQAPERAKLQGRAPLVLGSERDGDRRPRLPSSLLTALVKITSKPRSHFKPRRLGKEVRIQTVE